MSSSYEACCDRCGFKRKYSSVGRAKAFLKMHDCKPTFADCGTPRGYRAHRHRNEPTCPACRAAIAAYMREWRRQTGRTKTMLVPVQADTTKTR